MLAGRIADAAAACRLVLGRDHDRSVTGPVRICLGHVLLAQGHVHDALRELERAAESPVLTGAESAAALAWAGYARLWLGDLDGAWAEAEEARVAAVSADDHLSVSVAMATLTRVSEFRGRLQDALQIIDEAVRLADLSPGQARKPLPGPGNPRAHPYRARPARGGQVRAERWPANQRGPRRPLAVACLPGVPFIRAPDRRGMGRCHRRT